MEVFDADSDNLSNNMKYPRKIFSIAHEIIPPISSWRLGSGPGSKVLQVVQCT